MEQGQRSEYSEWLLAVQYGVWIPAAAIDVILPKAVQTMAGTHPAICSVGMRVVSYGGAANCAVYLLTHLHLASRWIMSEAVLLVPHMSSWNGQEQIYVSYIFKLDVHLQGNVSYYRHCTHFVLLVSTCGLAQNMVTMMRRTMVSNRRRRGYLRTVTFEWVCKTPHLLLYSSISVHCHTVNSLFRLPQSMLTVLYRNLPACHFIGQEEQ